MYSINIKGKVTSKDKKLVKQEMIFFQTGYNRVSKVLKSPVPSKTGTMRHNHLFPNQAMLSKRTRCCLI